MEFPLKKPAQPLLKSYTEADIHLVKKFSEKTQEVFGDQVKAVVLNRTGTEQITHETKDANNIHKELTILILLDDTSETLHPDAITVYVKKIGKIIREISPRIRVHTVRLTEHWQKIVKRDQTYLEILRNSMSVYDAGFYEPFQRLLAEGKIKPSMEARMIYYTKAQTTLKNSKNHVLQAVIDLYWACIDASHAVIMKYNESPPPPKEMGNALRHTLVAKQILHETHANTMDLLYKTAKEIMHKQKQDINGKEYDDLEKRATGLIEAIRKILSL